MQVCFPGGMVDEDDSTIVHTSLREMEEELGIVSFNHVSCTMHKSIVNFALLCIATRNM